MKNIWKLGLSAFMLCLPLSSYASFSLDSIQSIQCSDANPSINLNVYFTTDDASAGKYVRRSDDIPYDYYNKNGLGDAQSGVMTLSNNPDAENGKIALVDAYNPASRSQLVLEPTLRPGQYNGSLSGNVETQSGWGNLEPHAMTCTLILQSQ